MSQLDELESRITAAMERIQAGLGALSANAGAPDPADGDLAAALEEERLVTAQLEERLKRIKEKHAEEIAGLQAQVAGAEDLDALKAEVAALKASLAEAQADTGQADALRQEVERLKADLAESTQSDATGAEIDALQAQLAKQAETAARLDMDVQRLRQSNDQLRAVNATLREANEASVGEPSLINKAMLAELEGLRAARATDAAEAGAILARLEPLLANAVSLPEGEEG
ncbi:hypothetical protein [Antarcticimicrobium luteum]|uniref:Colicin transporter n=1 Tax=Antarcticimicrobium luteum TaxID=2547397 RepID=A0A4R5VDU5_9RHOB|nr:hypothetical protein [Antarcticimicrobium luteum]TDK50337.1 hypothetical protein E1832_06835 [Antarcticimicrobium luteum]